MTLPPDRADGLRMLLADLPEADVRRLGVFVGVRSTRLQHAWQIVGEGPVDMYIHDADQLPTVPGTLDRTPLRVSVLNGAAPADESLVLGRPLQYESFVDLLVEAERRLAPAGGPAAPPAPLADAVPAGRRFRLRRWPGAGTLQSVRHGMRMASFLSARYLSVDELSQLSGLDRDDCSRFLSTLLDAELLRSEPAVNAPRAAAFPDRVAPASAPRADRGLLSSLRQKLGIRPAGR